MLVSKVMSCPVVSATTTTTIIEAADSMRLHEVGALPVFQEAVFGGIVLQGSVLRFDGSDGIEGAIVVGIVTDRDIVTRGLTDTRSGFDPDMQVAAIMSRGVITCHEDQDVREAAELMGERRVRRLLVLDMSDTPVGILSIGDIAEHVSEELAGQVLGEVVELRAHDAQVRPADATRRHRGS